MKKTGVQVVAAIVVGVFAIGILLAGDKVQLSWLRFYSAAVLVSTIVLAIWDRFLWRLSMAQRLSQVPRDLRGTWKGRLESFWIDPKTGTPPPQKQVYLVVRQTDSTVSVVLLTDEGKSTSSLGAVSTSANGVTLDYLYLNRPDSKFDRKSRMHHGSTTLDVTGRPATRLRGRYWTDRDSRGELDFTERRSTLAEDFDQAANLFE